MVVCTGGWGGLVWIVAFAGMTSCGGWFGVVVDVYGSGDMFWLIRLWRGVSIDPRGGRGLTDGEASFGGGSFIVVRTRRICFLLLL